MLVEILALLGLKGIASVGCAIDDAKTKRNTTALDSNGNVTCIGRTGKYYVNGEPTYSWMEVDKNGNSHYLEIGQNSGKVYHDNYDDKVKRWNEEAEKSKREALKNGSLSYARFDPRFWCYVTVEIETGKIISCLFRNIYNGECRKFYLSDEMILQYGKGAHDKTAPNDYGIIISEDEYNCLKKGAYYRSYSDMPNMEVYKKLTDELADIKYIKDLRNIRSISYCHSLNERDKKMKEYFKWKYGENYSKIMYSRIRNMDGNVSTIAKKEKNNYYKCVKSFSFKNETYYPNDIFECDKNGSLKIGETYVGNINTLKEYFERV